MSLDVFMPEQGHDTNIAMTVAAVLHDLFSDDALAAAKRQLEFAEGDQREIWVDIVSRLSR